MKRALLSIFLGLALGAVGNADFADELDREAEEKLARPMRFYLLETSTNAATPAECERALAYLRMHFEVVMTINTTRDGIQWAGVKHRIGLDKLCRVLGIAGKGSEIGDEIDGSKVWDFVKDGRIAEVAARTSAAKPSVAVAEEVL